MVIPPNSIPAVFANTGIELQATIEFVKWCKDNYYGNVQIIRPEKSFQWCIDNKGRPIKSKMKSEYISRYQRTRTETSLQNLVCREIEKSDGSKVVNRQIVLSNNLMHLVHPDFDIKVSQQCCQILKKDPFSKYAKENDIKGYMLGIRMGEGGARKMKALARINEGGKICTATKEGKIVKMPIIDWSDEECDEYIKKYNVPLSKAYTEYGELRTGCFCCPFAKNNAEITNRLKSLKEHEPQRYKASLHWMQDVYIAQGVHLNFDKEYEAVYRQKWTDSYDKMRVEMIDKYRPEKSHKYKKPKQQSIYDLLGEEDEN